MLKIKGFVFNVFSVNTYVVWDEASSECVVVDPGMTDERECSMLDEFIFENNLSVTGIANTHLHLDHSFGIEHVRTRYKVKLMCGSADAPLGESVPEQTARFGLPYRVSPVSLDVSLCGGDEVKIGAGVLKVLEVPGHTPGSIALYSPVQKFVIVGDVLFEGSIGRTDLPGGDYRTLIDSIRRRLLALPDDVTVYSGHGNPTTIGHERTYNPYIQ